MPVPAVVEHHTRIWGVGTQVEALGQEAPSPLLVLQEDQPPCLVAQVAVEATRMAPRARVALAIKVW